MICKEGMIITNHLNKPKYSVLSAIAWFSTYVKYMWISDSNTIKTLRNSCGLQRDDFDCVDYILSLNQDDKKLACISEIPPAI